VTFRCSFSVCASKTLRLSRGTLRKLIGRQCPMKRIRHRRADAPRKCFGLPRPTPPRFRARAHTRHARRPTIAVPNPSRATPSCIQRAPANPISLLLTALQVLQRLVGRRSSQEARRVRSRVSCFGAPQGALGAVLSSTSSAVAPQSETRASAWSRGQVEGDALATSSGATSSHRRRGPPSPGIRTRCARGPAPQPGNHAQPKDLEGGP
jgi:hypothetical protein